MGEPLEIQVAIPQERMFNGLILHAEALIPTVVPLVIQSVTTVVPPIQVPPTKRVNFGIGCPYQSMSVKLQLDNVDRGNFTCKFTIFDIPPLIMDQVHKIIHNIQIVESTQNRTSIYRCDTTFQTIGGKPVTVTDTVIKSHEAYQTFIVKAIEAFLYANPDGVK